MSELKKSTKPATQILPRKCPVCGVDTNYVYLVHESKADVDGKWYRCQCQVIFNSDIPIEHTYDSAYIKDFLDSKEYEYRAHHAARTYAPLVEELTLGRMFLDVGYTGTAVIDYMKDRGWLTWGIDNNNDAIGNKNLYRGDFMTYDFSPATKDAGVQKMIDDGKIKRRFDVIWLSHVLECTPSPRLAIERISELLQPDGVVYIATPDIDFINKTGVSSFPHWDARNHHVMWSEPALNREFERAGFKTIMSRRNYSSRFMSWYDIHAIYQKNYF